MKYNIINNNNIPNELLLGISPKGISINTLERKLLEEVPFSRILSWGVNDIVVVIVYDRNGEVVKVYFETPQVMLL